MKISFGIPILTISFFKVRMKMNLRFLRDNQEKNLRAFGIEFFW